MVTVQQLVSKAFSRYRERTCVRWDGGSATYAETARRVRSLALAMQQRTPVEGHVGIILPNGREFIETMLACAMAGRVRVPLGEREPVNVLAQKLVKADCRLLITTEAWYEQLRDVMGDDVPSAVIVGPGAAALVSFEDLATIPLGSASLVEAKASERYRLSFTGGTTGEAKAVVQTHRQELALVRNLLMEVLRPARDRVFVAATPLSHASGTFVLPTVLGGGQLSWTRDFQAERLADSSWLGECVGVHTFVVPTALDDLAGAASGADHALDTVVYGGAPCPQPVLERAVGSIGPRLVQLYGQAEASMTICILPADEHADPAAISGCSGYPFLHVDVALERDGTTVREVGETGEVVVRSDHVMQGYWQQPEASAQRFTEDGGLRTQDLGRWDEHGRLWLVGRSREMFISGGYNVFPGEVERRLGGVDGVRALAVFAVPHPRWGDAGVLAIVPGDPAIDRQVLLEKMEELGRERLAAYERPKRVVFVDELPLTSVGKVSRNELSARFSSVFEVR